MVLECTFLLLVSNFSVLVKVCLSHLCLCCCSITKALSICFDNYNLNQPTKFVMTQNIWASREPQMNYKPPRVNEQKKKKTCCFSWYFYIGLCTPSFAHTQWIQFIVDFYISFVTLKNINCSFLFYSLFTIPKLLINR